MKRLWKWLWIRRRATRRGLALLEPYGHFLPIDTPTKRICWLKRNLLRLDWLCTGRPAFRKREDVWYDWGRVYFGNEKCSSNLF